MKSSRAITLVELLLVIVVVFVLMALLFPGGGHLNSAKKAEASNDVTQIANATLAYQTEYGAWPTTSRSTAAPVNGAFLQALMGSNSKNITFLEVSPWKKGKGGVISNTYEDPWGNAYQIVIDTGSMNSVSNLPSWSGRTVIKKTVAVWMQTNSIFTGIKDRIPATSW